VRGVGSTFVRLHGHLAPKPTGRRVVQRISLSPTDGPVFDRDVIHGEVGGVARCQVSLDAGGGGNDQAVGLVKSDPSAGATPIPVYVAAMDPKALQVTGELADGTLPYLAGPRTIGEFFVPEITKAPAAPTGTPGSARARMRRNCPSHRAQ
jgi:hypothetical protein